jgi:PAS domain S-box-containing protein
VLACEDERGTGTAGRPLLKGQREQRGASPRFSLTPYIRTAATVASVALLYVLAARWGLAFWTVQNNVSLVWPPSGIALAALLLCGTRALPGVVVGAFLATASTGAPLTFALATAIGNSLEALAGAYLLRRVVRLRRELDRLRDVLGLIVLAAILSTTVGATIGVTGLYFAAMVPISALSSAWFTWWLGDALGITIVAPAFLACIANAARRVSLRRVPEAIVFFAALALTSHLIFGVFPVGEEFDLPLAYLPLIPLLWAAFRYGPAGSAVATLLVAGIAISGTSCGYGPFAAHSLQVRLTLSSTFLSVCAVTTLILSAVQAERDRAQRGLQRARDRLDVKVHERTAELRRTNGQLEAQIAERRRTETALHQQFEALLTIFNGLAGAVCVADLETHELLAVNQYFREHFGADWTGRKCYELLHSGQTGPCPFCTNHLLVNEDGEPNPPVIWESQDALGGRWHQRIDRAIRWPDGRLVHLEVALDITARKQTEEALRRTTQLLNSILTSASAYAIAAIGPDSRVLHFNPAAERLFGYPAKAVIGKTLQEIHTRAGIPPLRLEQAVQAALREGKWESTFEMHRPDGSAGFVQAVVMPMHDHGAPDAGFVLFARDVTHELALETQLRESQTMEAIGRLAGGVAHEFNNVLAAILGHNEIVAAAVPYDHPIADHIGRIKTSTERAAQLVRQLLAFSRRQVVQPCLLNLNNVVAETVQMLRPLLGEHIRVETRLEPALGLVRADPAQIELLITNLSMNARDAMPDGGTLTLEATALNLEEPAPGEHESVVPGRYVTLAVHDTGRGLDAAARAHLFEPFFTTKAAGEGSGIGLATVYGIVQQHQGRIVVHSVPKNGTTFRVYLPLASDGVELPPPAGGFARCARGTATILLVEDEGDVREVAHDMLAAEGYSVLPAEHGPAALELCRGAAGPIDLLITDVVMPGMNGRELAGRIVQLQPEVKVLFISGYAANFLTAQGQLPPEVAFLVKPFTQAALAAKVRELLNPAAPARSTRPDVSALADGLR